jgi:hypothetical protein
MLFGLSTDQLIAVSSSVAAAISALATFFTVLQVSENRKSSYRPEIIFANTRFSSTRKVKNDHPNTDPEKYISVDMYNIGLGSAKNIEISWSFLINSTVEKMNSLANLGAKLNRYKFENDMIFSEGENSNISISVWRNQKTLKIDFVLPASIDNQPQVISIPPAYIELWDSYVTSAISIDQTELLEDFPPLTCIITYQDVGGVKYKLKREFLFDIYSISPDKGIEGSVSTKVW